MSLNLFKKSNKVKEEKLHKKYKVLRDNPLLLREREILENWTEKFVDRDNKIVEEFQKSFHSSFWEFYLYAVFSELGFKIDFSKKAPDFVVFSPCKILIEAVISNIKDDGRKEDTRTAEDFVSMMTPPHQQPDFFEVLDEAIVRHSNAILKKEKKYIEYKTDDNEPYIIALSSYSQINYGREYIYPMMALLYGRYYDPLMGVYNFRTSIKKPNSNADIPIGLFTDSKFENISAVIFSCTTTMGKLTALANSTDNPNPINHVLNIRHDFEEPFYIPQHVSPNNPEYLSDGLFIFHNPFAKNKVDKSIFQKTNATQIFIHDNGFHAEGGHLPIYARNNNTFRWPEDYIKRVFKNFNDL